ncbi:MAG TPA: hypothetical protein VHH36_01090, partial [Candidatus Thermoplasmatota archaeon]|nr:hypothetical protein [Candidatus Thermoplasmatota archaeon]
HAQAAAATGSFALLLDAAGSDAYEMSGQYGQAHASHASMALLVDAGVALEGNETFRLHRHGQGDAISDGWAILVEADGRNRYAALGAQSCCAQGAGRFLGVGMLVDGRGSDAYEGGDHVQGSFYLGSTWDVYDSPQMPVPAAQGPFDAAHRETSYGGVGVLLDLQGDADSYRALGHSQGFSSGKGMGVFVDFQGTGDSVVMEDPGGDGQGCAYEDGHGFLAVLGSDATTSTFDFLKICSDGSGGGVNLGELV